MSLRSLRALCLTSFFIADVRDGLGPFLGIFLTERHWTPDDIGILMTAGGLAGLLATLPAGFITDTSRSKRTVLALVCLLITLARSCSGLASRARCRRFANCHRYLCGVCRAADRRNYLGLTGQGGFSAQMGKNEAFNHGGNFVTALIAGGIAWYWGVGGIFLLMTCTTLLTLCAACHSQRGYRQRRRARAVLFSEPAGSRLCRAD
jgi:MFS family permease